MVDEQEILWDLFSRNNIEEATAEVRFDGHQQDKFEIKICPKSKTAILFEPVVFEPFVALRSVYDVEDLIRYVAIESVFAEENALDDLRKIFIINFFTKNKRISVDVLGL